MNKSSLIKIASACAVAASTALLTALSCSDENGISNAFLNQRKENASYVTDNRDGKAYTYRTVKIGNVTWMAENAKYPTAASRCYNDAGFNCAKFGQLYTWADAAMNACPAGWRLPDNADWKDLHNAVGNDASALKAKEWGGTDKYGWSALPGGYGNTGAFSPDGSAAGWWSASENGRADAAFYSLTAAAAPADSSFAKTRGGSVRCVEGAPKRRYVAFDANGGTTASGLYALGVDNGQTLGDRFPAVIPKKPGGAFAGWYTAPTGGAEVTKNSSFSKNDTVYAHWETPGGEYGGILDSRDSKTYATVRIGGQTWMAENLNYATDSSWCYNNSPDSCAKYGRLYTWNAAMAGADTSDKNPSGVQGACPKGWHIPSYAEWAELATAVGGTSSPLGTSWTNAGKKLRAERGWWTAICDGVTVFCGSGTIGVIINNNGTDDYGFSALPGGRRDRSNGSLTYIIHGGYWWTANTPDRSISMESIDDMNYYQKNTGTYNYSAGYSVRCVKDY